MNSARIEPRLKPVRRIVTGHDAAGRSIILQNALAQQVLAIGVAEHGVTDIWRTHSIPADNCDVSDPCQGPLTLAPPKEGTVFRVVEFPPDREYLHAIDHKAAFSAMGDDAVEAISGNAAIIMHKTNSLDYAVVLSGEIYAVMDEGEALMQLGDVLVQRGTNHGWSNRSDAPAIVAFVLMGAKPLPET